MIWFQFAILACYAAMLATGWHIIAKIRELIAAIHRVDRHITLTSHAEPLTPPAPGEMVR